MADNNKDSHGSMFEGFTVMHSIATVVALLAIGGIIWFMYTDGKSLQDADKARSLITFSVAIVTVAIALLLVFFVIISNETASELKEKFAFGKDVLMVFVGILGTIMGFYYGTDKISTKEIPGIATQQSANNQLETRAFELLLKQDYQDAINAFDLASKSTPISPNISNINAIVKFLQDNREDLSGTGDNTAQAWRSLYCDIIKNNRAVGLSKEVNDKFESGCKTNIAPSGNSASTPIASPAR